MKLRIATLYYACSAVMMLAIGNSSPAHAQLARSCDDFTTRLIRVEPGGFLGSSRIVTGTAGTEVLKLGYRTANLDSLMQASDSALAYSIDYGRHARRGTVLMGLTLLTSVAPPLFIDFNDSDNNGLKWATYGASFALGLWGSSTQRHANRSLSRAVWYYNVSVEQSTPEPCVTARP
jgi:hypothetical protein